MSSAKSFGTQPLGKSTTEQPSSYGGSASTGSIIMTRSSNRSPSNTVMTQQQHVDRVWGNHKPSDPLMPTMAQSSSSPQSKGSQEPQAYNPMNKWLNQRDTDSPYHNMASYSTRGTSPQEPECLGVYRHRETEHQSKVRNDSHSIYCRRFES